MSESLLRNILIVVTHIVSDGEHVNSAAVKTLDHANGLRDSRLSLAVLNAAFSAYLTKQVIARRFGNQKVRYCLKNQP